jgi:hypothetical protein
MTKEVNTTASNSARFQVKESPTGNILASFATREEADRSLKTFQNQTAKASEYANALVVDAGVGLPPTEEPSARDKVATAARTAEEKKSPEQKHSSHAAPQYTGKK